LKGIFVLLLLDGIRDGLQGRLGRRHGRRCEEGVGWTSRSDGGSDSEAAAAEAESQSGSVSSSPDPNTPTSRGRATKVQNESIGEAKHINVCKCCM
jgi:hypothetical protein